MKVKAHEVEPTKEQIGAWFAKADLAFDDYNNWATDNFEIAARLAYAAGKASERERCRMLAAAIHTEVVNVAHPDAEYWTRECERRIAGPNV